MTAEERDERKGETQSKIAKTFTLILRASDFPVGSGQQAGRKKLTALTAKDAKDAKEDQK